MLDQTKSFQKAALQNAAFCVLSLCLVLPAAQANIPNSKQEKKQSQLRFEDAKKKITSLILLKQRDQALQALAQAESETTEISLHHELLRMRQNILLSFLSPEAQDYYELSATQLIQNTKQSERNNQKCLALEPDNIQCLWQELRILNRRKDSTFTLHAEKFLTKVKSLPEYKILSLSLRKTEPAFLSKPLSLTTAGLASDQTLLPYILEFERTMQVKNFSRAKEMIEIIEGLGSDYPDLLYMKNLLAERSAEEIGASYQSIYDVYRKKCESVTGELTRKYYYDIDLCNRG